MRSLVCLLLLAMGQGSAIQAAPAYRTPAVLRQLVTSSLLGGCKTSSADCVTMYGISGTRDTVTAEYRLPAGEGELEPMFEDLRRKEVGSALSPSFSAADFSCLFSRGANNSVYIDGSFSFSDEVVAAVTVFTARPGAELFMMSGSAASQACAADAQRPIPIVLGNGLNDGAVAYARVHGAGRTSSCIKLVNGGSRNGEKFACVQPSNTGHKIEYYQDGSCSSITVSMNVSLPAIEVEQAASSGRPFVGFAMLLGDSHQKQPFVSYADPISSPPHSNSGGGSADTALARFFSGRTFYILVYCLSALIVLFVVTGIHSWNKLVDFGDVVLYRLPSSSNGGGDKLGIAVAVLDCSHGLKYRNAGRSMMLQPLKHLTVSAPADGVRSLRPADGAITEDALMQRMLASPSVRSVLSSGVSSAADLRILSDLGPPVAPATGSPLRPTVAPHDADMAIIPPLPAAVTSSTHAVDWALRAEGSFSDAGRSLVSPVSRPTSPDQGATSYRGTEVTQISEPQISAYKGEKDFYVFIEDETRSPLIFARKTFIMTMIDDIAAALYCLLVYPVLLLCSWITPCFTPASGGKPAESVVSVETNADLIITHPEPRAPQRWSSMSLFGRAGPGCVQTDDVVVVLSTGQGDDFRNADIVKVNRRLFQQYLRFRRQELDNDSISIEKLMSDRRMKGTGISGGDLRALDRCSEDGDSPPDSVTGARRRGRRSGKRSPGGPSYWSRRMPFRQMRSMGEDDEECLPFIREVFDEMQEELDLEEELAHDVEMRRLDEARVSGNRREVDPASEYYIAVLTTATFSNVSA